MMNFTQLCQLFVAIVHMRNDEPSVGGQFPGMQIFFDDGDRQRTTIGPRSVESTFGGEAAEDVGAEVQEAVLMFSVQYQLTNCSSNH